MKIFLFYINAIVGLDEWTDRKLIFQVSNLLEEDNKLHLSVDTDEPINFRKLCPTKSYALQFEYESGEKILKYYTLKAFEISPPDKESTVFKVILHVKRIEIEA